MVMYLKNNANVSISKRSRSFEWGGRGGGSSIEEKDSEVVSY